MRSHFRLLPKVPGISPVPGRCLIYYILVPSFYIDFYLVLHSGRASQIHVEVIDLVLCSVKSVLFPLRSERECCYCNIVSFRDVLVSPVLSPGHICTSDTLQPLCHSCPGHSPPFLPRSCLLALSS